jgi:hypothetical protein
MKQINIFNMNKYMTSTIQLQPFIRNKLSLQNAWISTPNMCFWIGSLLKLIWQCDRAKHIVTKFYVIQQIYEELLHDICY